MNAKPRQLSLHIYIATLFLILLAAFAAVSLSVQYAQTKQMMLSAANSLFQNIGRQTQAALGEAYRPAELTVGIAAHTELATATTLEERLRFLPMLAEMLGDRESLSALYIGHDNGEFFLLRRLANSTQLARTIAPPDGSAFLVQSVDLDNEGLREGRFLFFDRNLRPLADRAVPNYVYDPRTRPWYGLALATDKVVASDPYLFFTTREVGATFAQKIPDGGAVVGADVTLKAITALLGRLRPTPSAQIFIFNDRNEILANPDSSYRMIVDDVGTPRLPRLGELGQPALAMIATDLDKRLDKPAAMDVDGEEWQSMVMKVGQSGAPLYVAIAAPQHELLAVATRIRNRSLLILLGALLVAIPIALALSQLASRPLDALTAEARSIRALRFDKASNIRSPILEIDQLAQSMQVMKSTIRQLLNIGNVLAGERNFDRLLDRILLETMQIAKARGGIVYLSEPDGDLIPAMARWGDATMVLPADPVGPAHDDAHPLVAATGKRSLMRLLQPADTARWFPAIEGAVPMTVLALRLRNRQGEVVGGLMLFQDGTELADASEGDIQALVEAVSGTAAIAVETQRLILEQKALLKSMIEVIGDAIDAKSPYTGGHCQRVPVLTEMLASAAAGRSDGVFKDFHLTPEGWEELHLAAWLHDCGKVTTPEYVVDKATKLETIHDRLHEVRMRFEVIKREAEVACWKAIADGGARDENLAALRALWVELDAEFSFVANSNVGGEFMSDADVDRIKRIAERRWTRTLDDRIGLAHHELERKARAPAEALPASEPLLSDRPEHIFHRDPRDGIAADNPWGFKMAVPEHLYNRGEVYNLTIRRGTLNAEERFKINGHMLETIRMLTRLPLPRHMRNVTEIAGGHHEKMDGTGYPRRLSRDQMSIPARMMAVADIFEALTAADRPYKKAKTLSESLAIMAKMRDENHIDPDIFELFLTSGVYGKYASEFLEPHQIDQVDIAPYLRPA